MNCFIITGFASSDKGLQAANIYTGNDGVEAAQAALAAAKTGKFVKIGKLVNPSMAPLPTREYKLEVSGAPKLVVIDAHKPPVGASLNPTLDKQHDDLAAEREKLAKADADKIAKAKADQLAEMRAREKKIEAERQRQQRLAPDIDGGTDGNSDPKKVVEIQPVTKPVVISPVAKPQEPVKPVTKPVESKPETKPESKPQEPQQKTSETASATPTPGAAQTDNGENKEKKNET